MTVIIILPRGQISHKVEKWQIKNKIIPKSGSSNATTELAQVIILNEQARHMRSYLILYVKLITFFLIYAASG